ncbi:DUF4389 domain-containing protein [Dietzia maris]
MGAPQPAPSHSDPNPGSTAPPRSGQGTRPLNWIMLVAGVLLTALGLGLTAAGILLAAAEASQRDGRYAYTETEQFRSVGNAIITAPFTLDLDGEQAASSGAVDLEDLISVRVRATPVVPGQRVFLGMAPADAVDEYLRDVPHAVFGTDPWADGYGMDASDWTGRSGSNDDVDEVPGTRVPGPPADERFWERSVTGSTQQTLNVDLGSGNWVIVVMNSDGSRPVWVDVQAGAHTELLGFANPATLIAGIVGLVLGIPLILLGAAGLGRDVERRHPGVADAAGADVTGRLTGLDPLRLTGHLDPGVSRALWLIKWALAIPHYIVLAVLGFAAVVVTVAAGLAILFTGRYPRSWFSFIVGAMRWHWRVGFYAYAALGTDRYPPFALGRADYPADLDVVYPERLSRGLVLVKWWLLVIPHLLIVGIITGSGAAAVDASTDNDGISVGFTLLGLLVLIAAIGLLFTGRYLPGLFALNVGLNRWVYRVASYVLLLRDEYPPFRLDQGPTEPAPAAEHATPAEYATPDGPAYR